MGNQGPALVAMALLFALALAIVLIGLHAG